MLDDTDQDKVEFLKVDVQGKNAVVWERVRAKFMAKIEVLLDSVINFEDNTTVREEARSFSTELVKFAKAKLQQPGVANQKTLAEIDEVYSKIKLNLAEARNRDAEAADREFNTKLKRLRLAICIAKAMTTGHADEKAIIFIKELDAFMGVVKDFEQLGSDPKGLI